MTPPTWDALPTPRHNSISKLYDSSQLSARRIFSRSGGRIYLFQLSLLLNRKKKNLSLHSLLSLIFEIVTGQPRYQWLYRSALEWRKKMNKKELIAPCGMNCGICTKYLREKNRCPGCREPNEKKPATRWVCKITNCDIFQKNNFEFCFECEKYPCVSLKQLDNRYRTKYCMSMIENLENVKQSGITEFFKIEKERWACSECGGTICVHKKACSSCGGIKIK